MTTEQLPGLFQWLANGKRGISSETMVQHLTGVDVLGDWHMSHPHDPDDLDRCLQLLEAVPALRQMLPKMATASPAWAALVAHWDDVEQCHLEEVGLRWTKACTAPKTYALMESVLAGAKTGAAA